MEKIEILEILENGNKNLYTMKIISKEVFQSNKNFINQLWDKIIDSKLVK